MSVEWQGFLTAVEQMRECQKEYFRTRSPSALAAAKNASGRWTRSSRKNAPSGRGKYKRNF